MLGANGPQPCIKFVVRYISAFKCDDHYLSALYAATITDYACLAFRDMEILRAGCYRSAGNVISCCMISVEPN